MFLQWQLPVSFGMRSSFDAAGAVDHSLLFDDHECADFETFSRWRLWILVGKPERTVRSGARPIRIRRIPACDQQNFLPLHFGGIIPALAPAIGKVVGFANAIRKHLISRDKLMPRDR